MSERQIITTQSGEELVVVPRDEYDAMLAAAGNEAAEARAIHRIVEASAADRAAGRETLLPDWMSEAILSGASPIKAARHRVAMTQAALAARLAITQRRLSQMESGRKNPSADLLVRLASALDIDPELLLLKEAQAD